MASFTRVLSSSSAAALLLLFISLSPVSAGAFSCSTPLSAFDIKKQYNPSRVTSFRYTAGTGRSGPASASARKIMNGSPQSVLCVSELALIRGGDLSDVDESSSGDTTTESLDDINMKRAYGTHTTADNVQDDIDEESSPSSASIEMTSKAAATSLKSKTSDLTSDDTTTLISSSGRMALSAAVTPISSAMATFATFYTKQLSARPIITKSLTAGIIFMASDYCAQLIERGGGEEGEEKAPLVWSRMLTNFLVGLLVFGPAANAWYSMVFKFLPSTSLFSTLQKAALGQIIFGPAFTSVFFGAGMIQAGSFSLGGWLEKVKNDLPAVWASGLGFWPFVDFISYKVIPVQWIPLFVNFCSFVWTIYLSIVSNRSRGEEA